MKRPYKIYLSLEAEKNPIGKIDQEINYTLSEEKLTKQEAIELLNEVINLLNLEDSIDRFKHTYPILNNNFIQEKKNKIMIIKLICKIFGHMKIFDRKIGDGMGGECDRYTCERCGAVYTDIYGWNDDIGMP